MIGPADMFGGRQVVEGTYHAVEADPLPPFAFLTAIPKGLAEAQDIIFFVFVVGGVISVVRATGRATSSDAHLRLFL